MPISAGTRFGSYEIVEPIGSGGMGEVWLARDTELKRDVAVKVLPASFAADADRLARFRREAELLATLNHANIAQVYGLETIDEQIVIVMELIDGPTLAERLEQGPIPPDEALGIGLQILSALEAAHANQIVHRDLKPANVKLKPDGTVKVLDFGISKSIDPQAISGSPVMTTPAVTQTGVILGTAAYMSPEQARGKFVDERTDVWAFGCLLFEMLTGQPAFGGEDVMLTLARVLDRDTDFGSIPKTISPAVRHTLKLCLEKDPRRRIADVRDVRLAIEGAFESELPRGAEHAAAMRPWWRRALLPAGTLVAGAALVAVLAVMLWPVPEPKFVNRFVYSIPSDQTLQIPAANRVLMSPDGRRLIYNTVDGFYIRELDEIEATPIPGPENTPAWPLLSPDGQQLFYLELTANRMVRMSIAGGVGTTVLTAEAAATMADDPVTISWMPNGDWLVSHRGGISEVAPVEGSQATRLIDVGEDHWVSDARLLPDGDTVVYAIRDSADGFASARIVAQSIAAGTSAEPIEIIPRGNDPRFIGSGHLLYVLDGVVRAIAFDPATLETSGDSEPVLSDVGLGALTGMAEYSIADDDTLAYIASQGTTAAAGALAPGLAWLSENGVAETLPIELPEDFIQPQLSHDGQRLAVAGLFNGAPDIYVFDSLDRPVGGRRITRDPGADIRPVWTIDDQRIIYFSDREQDAGIYWRAANGQGQAELLWAAPDDVVTIWPNWVHPDGDRLIFAMNTPEGGVGIWQIRLEPGAEPEVLIDQPDVTEGFSSLSPDGNWLAYGSNESGATQEIYIVPYPDTQSGKIGPISAGGGSEPFWSASGDELYFVVPDSRQIMRVDVTPGPDPVFGEPQWLSSLRAPGATARLPNYNLDRVSQRFLAISVPGLSTSPGSGSTDRIIIIQHFDEWLKQEVPVD